ncbi:beta-N-acetylhexosaminidase [Pseudokordiimonas caeni]|uniref:beta-N-acetylhexosaminidase n=1 Tax=Pseudokordiimonas caeni TaxID=2997908 RepID=UPI002812267A|nr:beta-N-acetylhexosaminidase [Pseudokordiimonas caeni]
MIPVVFGCAGTTLSDEEAAFFSEVKPAGFILFARNVGTPDEVRTLVTALKKTTGRKHVPVLIDQEGGRVQRLREPHWRAYPSMETFGRMARQDATLGASALRLNCRLIADDLVQLGINVNCLPVLDVPQRGADKVIGDRAFAHDPQLVGALGRIALESMADGGVLGVLKHIPGHGRSLVDSHLGLPRVSASLDDLSKTDFAPFVALHDAPLAMTAHIIYQTIDPARPATLSKVVIGRIIRMKIGFQGILFSDDLSMNALEGPIEKRAADALAAGCDIALHCNGNLAEMKTIAAAVPRASLKLEERLATLIEEVSARQGVDRADLEKRYRDLMARYKPE